MDAECGPIFNSAHDNQLYSVYAQCQQGQGGGDGGGDIGGGGPPIEQLQQACPDEMSACQAETQCMDQLNAFGDPSADSQELHVVKDCMANGSEQPCPFSIEQALAQCEQEVFACDITPSCMDALIVATGTPEFRGLYRCVLNRESESAVDVCPGENGQDDATSAVVEVQVTLSATMEQVEADRDGFEASFKSSVAAELSVELISIEITNIAAGSVVVSFTVVDLQVAADSVSTTLGGAALVGFAVTAVEAVIQESSRSDPASHQESSSSDPASRPIDCS